MFGVLLDWNWTSAAHRYRSSVSSGSMLFRNTLFHSTVSSEMYSGGPRAKVDPYSGARTLKLEAKLDDVGSGVGAAEGVGAEVGDNVGEVGTSVGETVGGGIVGGCEG